MGHVRQEIALCLVGLVRGLLLQLQRLRLVGLLLLLGAHLFDASGIALLPLVPEIVGQGDQREDDKADQDVEGELLANLREQLPVADDDDDIPLIHDRLHEHVALLSVDFDLKAAALHLQDPVQEGELILGALQVAALPVRVVMGDDHAVPVDDEAIALALDLQPGHDLLDVVHPEIDGKHVGSVGEHPANGDDHVARLRVHIGRNDGDLTVCLQCGDIPVSARRIIVRGRHPVQAIQIFAHDVAVEPGDVLVKMPFLVLRLLHNVVQDVLRGRPVVHHVIHRIRRDPQRAPARLQVVFKLSRGGGDPVFTHLADVRRRHIVDHAGGIHHHAYHQQEYDQYRHVRADPPRLRPLRGVARELRFIRRRHIREEAALCPGGLLRHLLFQSLYLRFIGTVLPVHLFQHMRQQDGDDRADHHGDRRRDQVSAHQRVHAPHQLRLAGGDAHVPPRVRHAGNHDAPRDAVIILQIDRLARIRADLGDHLGIGRVGHIHHAAGHIVKGICLVGMDDHAQVLVHQEGVAVFRHVRLADDVGQHVHKDIRGKHAHQHIVPVDRLGDRDDRLSGVRIPIGRRIKHLSRTGRLGKPVPVVGVVDRAVRHIIRRAHHAVVRIGKVDVVDVPVPVQQVIVVREIPVEGFIVLVKETVRRDFRRHRVDDRGVGIDPRGEFLSILVRDDAVILLQLGGHAVARPLIADQQEQSGAHQHHQDDHDRHSYAQALHGAPRSSQWRTGSVGSFSWVG